MRHGAHHHFRAHHRPLGPMGRFVRSSLRRRLFFWLFGSLLATALVMSAVGAVAMRVDGEPMQRQWAGWSRWFGQQFASHWDDAAQRRDFMRSSAEQLGVDLRLVDGHGAVLDQVGEGCRRPTLVAVTRGDVPLGTIELCWRHAPGPGWRLVLAVAVLLLILWTVAGKVARRLALPLDRLADTVGRIGKGELSARTDLGCAEPGEIGLVSDAVNDMAGRIEKQLKDQRELLATVSHELRTPLSRIRIITEIARDTGATPKTYDELDREVAEMDGLVGQLLASSRVDFGVLSARALSVSDVALQALERSGLPPTHLVVEGEGPTLTADATLVQRALMNLLDNAAKHGNGAEQLKVTLSTDRARFEVLDTGPGLSAPEAQLFTQFKKSTGDGLGLGLALVRRIAQAHGGDAFAQTRPTRGACVGFWIPRAPTAPA